jgi:pre-rRNA-processing protein IPI1
VLAERVVDGDSAVRVELRTLLDSRVLPLLGPLALRPFMPLLMAHVCG